MQRINFDIKDTQGLVLAPTRELAQQIQKVVVALGDYLDVRLFFYNNIVHHYVFAHVEGQEIEIKCLNL